jgi:hypothetical protein
MSARTLVAAACLLALPAALSAQPCDAPYTAPFALGERLDYSVTFGMFKAGQGSIEVVARDTVRGREAWHTRFRVKGGVPFYHVDDALESWIDVSCFQSLRFVRSLDERGKKRERRVEIDPGRAVYQEGDEPEQPSAPNALDDGSFFYFVRTQDLVVGQQYEYRRYFRPDRNPVVVRVLGRERVTVPAGTFDAIVVQPVIQTKGIFSQKGEARIWLSDDPRRLLVRVQAKVSFGTLTMSLTSYWPGCDHELASR